MQKFESYYLFIKIKTRNAAEFQLIYLGFYYSSYNCSS